MKIKKLICLLLVLVLSVVTVPTLTVLANHSCYNGFSKNYTLTRNPIDDMVAIASCQIGRTQAQIGYNEGWCDNFISDCAILAGQANAVPQGGDVNDFLNNLLNAGAYYVSTPRAGDIVIFKSGSFCTHAALMSDSVNCINGNFWTYGYSQVEKYSYSTINSYNGWTCIFVRPAYTTLVSIVTPTITFGKSSYTLGDTVTLSWQASPSNSNLSHYWVNVYNPDGSEYIAQGVQKNTSFSFTAKNIGKYKVKVFATPTGSQSGEGSLTDTKTITVKDIHVTHSYSNDCDSTCNICGYARVVVYHNFIGATCSNPQTCKICGETSGSKLGHDYDNDCDELCNRCGVSRVTKHKWAPADCTTPATCYICEATIGVALDHVYDNSCDSTCNDCNEKRTVKHAYKTKSTIKATKSKNGKIVKKCTICSKTSTTTIKYAKTFKLSATSYTYNGKVKTPAIVVKDSAGKALKKSTDYTVTYSSGRKKVGTYTVKIKMKGNYAGTKTLTFKIKPAKTKVSKLTAGKKSIKVSINKKSTQVTGYQIQYSTSKKFTKAKTKTISSYKTTKYTLRSLSAKKTYYVRVRTYKTVNKTKYYSGWSTHECVKTK